MQTCVCSLPSQPMEWPQSWAAWRMRNGTVSFWMRRRQSKIHWPSRPGHSKSLRAVSYTHLYVIAFIQPNGIPSGQELLSYFLGTYDIPDFLIYFITTVIGICIYSIFMFSLCYVIRNRYLYVFFTPLLLFIGIFSISSFLHPFLLQFSWYAQNSEIMAMPSCILPIALFAPGSLMEAIGFYNFIIGTIVRCV